MGLIKVQEYLMNLTKYDDIERDRENRIILDKYIDRVHADGIACLKPYYHGVKEPKRPYNNYKLSSPYARYLVKERRNSPYNYLKDNVEKDTLVNNEAIFGKIYNDVGVNAVEAYVAYHNTKKGKLFYSITEDLKTIKNCNKSRLVQISPSFFLHLSDMLENKDIYLSGMTSECFDDLTNALITAVITGETDMHSANTMVMKPIGMRKWTDICRVGVDERVFNDIVDAKGSLADIKENFGKSEIYSNSFGSASTRIFMSPAEQIEKLLDFKEKGLLTPSNIATINKLVNYNLDESFAERQENAGAILSDIHKDAIKYYISRAEVLAEK